MNIIGIDCGFFGAISYLWEDGTYGVYDAPITKYDGRTNFLVANMVLQVKNCCNGLPSQNVCVIEKVSSRPGEGSVSSFRFGHGVGLWVGILATLQIPTVFVSPQIWKRDLGLKGSDKRLSIELARKLFPLAPLTRLKDDGRAESLLVSYWYKKQYDR